MIIKNKEISSQNHECLVIVNITKNIIQQTHKARKQDTQSCLKVRVVSLDCVISDSR